MNLQRFTRLAACYNPCKFGRRSPARRTWGGSLSSPPLSSCIRDTCLLGLPADRGGQLNYRIWEGMIIWKTCVHLARQVARERWSLAIVSVILFSLWWRVVIVYSWGISCTVQRNLNKSYSWASGAIPKNTAKLYGDALVWSAVFLID